MSRDALRSVAGFLLQAVVLMLLAPARTAPTNASFLPASTSPVLQAAGNIHWTQYRDWRNNGTAFEFGDQVREHHIELVLLSVTRYGKAKGVGCGWARAPNIHHTRDVIGLP